MRVRYKGYSQYWDMRSEVTPLETSTDVMVAIDPSKSNMAVIIGTLAGKELALIEFSGNDKQFYESAMDTTEYLNELCEYLRRFLSKSNVEVVGIEQHILKQGAQYYQSSTVLTELRAGLIQLSLELTRKKAWEINNSAWKGSILPDGYRGKSEKGSLRYLKGLDRVKYQDYNDDMTDVTCIYWYMVKHYYGTNNNSIKCSGVEKPERDVGLMIMSDFLIPEGTKQFTYNPKFTLKDNAIYFANRTTESGFAQVPVDSLTLEDIYSYGGVTLPGSNPALYVLV